MAGKKEEGGEGGSVQRQEEEGLGRSGWFRLVDREGILPALQSWGKKRYSKTQQKSQEGIEFLF